MELDYFSRRVGTNLAPTRGNRVNDREAGNDGEKEENTTTKDTKDTKKCGKW